MLVGTVKKLENHKRVGMESANPRGNCRIRTSTVRERGKMGICKIQEKKREMREPKMGLKKNTVSD